MRCCIPADNPAHSVASITNGMGSSSHDCGTPVLSIGPADAGGLSLKAGNACILRAGSESVHSARAIHACLVAGLEAAFFSGLLLGLVLGIIGFLRIATWTIFTDMYGPHWALVGITVGISLVGIVLWGTLCGSMLPFLIRRCGLDPATSSAPFVATLVDVTGLVIYFSVAIVILRGTLL